MNKHYWFFIGLFIFFKVQFCFSQDVCSPIQKNPIDYPSENKVKISWSLGLSSCITDGDYFEVAYGTTQSCTDGSEITLGLYRYFYYNNLKRGQRNYFKIRGVSYDYGESEWSNIKYFDVPSGSVDPPTTPTNFRIDPALYQNSGESLQLSWSTSLRTKRYEIEEYWEENLASSYLETTTALSVTSHSEYSYMKFRVRAIGDGGISNWSSWAIADKKTSPVPGSLNINITNLSRYNISADYRINNDSWENVGIIGPNIIKSTLLGNISPGNYTVTVRWTDPSLQQIFTKSITKAVYSGNSTAFDFTIEDKLYHFSFNPNNWKIIKGNSLIVSGKILDGTNNPVSGVSVSVEDPIQMMSLPNVAISNSNGEFSYTIRTFSYTPLKNYTFTFYAGWTGNCYNLLTVSVSDPFPSYNFVLNDYYINAGELGPNGLDNDAYLLNAKVPGAYINQLSAEDQANAAKKFMTKVRDFGSEYIQMNIKDPALYAGIIGTITCVIPTGFTQVTTCPVGVTLLGSSLSKNLIVLGMHRTVNALPIDQNEKDKLHLAVDVGNFAVAVVTFKADISMLETVGSIGSVSTSAYDIITDVTNSYDKIVLAGSNGQETQAYLMINLNETSVPDNNYSVQPVLSQNYPNPFNETTTITFNVLSESYVSLKIFDDLGNEVSSLLSKILSPGFYSKEWKSVNIKSGIYFYRLQVGGLVETKKLIKND